MVSRITGNCMLTLAEPVKPNIAEQNYVCGAAEQVF